MPTKPIDMTYDYRRGMPSACSEALRVLRNTGFAVAVFNPQQVGHPMRRKRIEDAMVAAGQLAVDSLSSSQYRSVR
jgi:hypothetical protein